MLVVLPELAAQRPERSLSKLPAKVVPNLEQELPRDCWLLVPVLVASPAPECRDFELVAPSDWHLLAAVRLYLELVDPSDFVRRLELAVVALLVLALALQPVSHPSLLVRWERSRQVCPSLA